MANLIICPVGSEMPHDPRWKKEDHWRWTHNDRDYKTLVVVYNDFNPEPGSYDYLIRKKGLKWNLIPDVCKEFDWQDYDYIGCFDDDYLTDFKSINRSLEIARLYDFRLFQQSLT